ncbi:MAG TPA: M28 family metallopeptidase [Pseudomonadales bacterium]
MKRMPFIAALLLVAACNGEQEQRSPDTIPDQEPDSSPTAAPAQAPSAFAPEVLEAARTISADDLKATVAELSSDAYGGRGPGSEGDEKARRWLADRLQTLGYAPGNGDSFEQPFDLVSINAAQPKTWTFSKGDETLELAQRQDFIVASGLQEPSADVDEAELVFVGYGIEAPEYQWDDFGGADLEGKVLVMLNNDPDWDPALFEGERRLYYGRWTYKYESAARQGAAGAIIIHTTPSAGYPWQVVESSWSGPQFELPQGDEPRVRFKGWVTEDAARKLMQLAGQDLDRLVESARSRDFEPVPLGITTSIRLENAIERTRSANVLGLLEGSDPELADQVVVFTAHHDHLGTDPTIEGDGIYNGALDNAAGMAVVLSIAKAFTALPQPPRRSILINFVGAEEQGLLGSKYYAQNPTFPPGRIAANLNFDGGAIWGKTRDIGFIGLGKSDLDAVAREVADYQGRTLTGDQDPDKGFYYRSDQFSFARIGVPAIYPDAGREVMGKSPGWGQQQMDAYTAQHYHQPSDELTDAWDFSGMVQEAEFGFLAGALIANQDEMPRWNPGDEFEAARQKALAAVQSEGGGR